MLLLHFQLARQGCVALLLKVLNQFRFATWQHANGRRRQPEIFGTGSQSVHAPSQTRHVCKGSSKQVCLLVARRRTTILLVTPVCRPFTVIIPISVLRIHIMLVDLLGCVTRQVTLRRLRRERRAQATRVSEPHSLPGGESRRCMAGEAVDAGENSGGEVAVAVETRGAWSAPQGVVWKSSCNHLRVRKTPLRSAQDTRG
mmetsp:Transcript_28634/g.54805  ORF Transcript_28634/g.54805 Transcript_28634/m.54805 type:complete len:200 (+) Transcript_28634:633-1232(+)